jgi:predicted Zn-dependent protease
MPGCLRLVSVRRCSSSRSRIGTPRTAPAILLAGLLGTIGGANLAGCRQTPMTGRARLFTVSEQEERQRGEQLWREVLACEQVSTQAGPAELIERVGRRLAAVSGRPDEAWEFKLLASDQANAFCLPGGKVAVSEGLLPICEHEAGLAVVMSHEMAHVLARHGEERLSQQGAVKGAGGWLERSARDRWRAAYGLTTQNSALLPYSRQQEAEADSIGLTLLARAGYDPAEAPRFWERFAQASGSQPPAFCSMHPSDAQRVAHLRSLLPQALALYQAAPQQWGLGKMIPTPSGTPRGGGWGTTGTVQPARGEAAASTQVQPALAEEFVPPIQRPRAAPSEIMGETAPPAGAASGSAPPPGEPPPFPDLSAGR